jgi:iron complex outermembrane receptor protein
MTVSPRLQRTALLPASISLALALSAPAFAAVPQTAPDATQLDAVQVVAGSIQQGQEQIEIRRNTDGIVDSLVQDDTGDLPDQNITEALRRVPGVGTLYRDDEGQFITIRGITPDLNHTMIDGITMISVGDSGDGTRRVDMGMIPSQVARRTDIYKTFTADLESGSVGGVVNLVPRSAFQNGGKDALIVDAQLNWADYNTVPNTNNLHDDNSNNLGKGLSALWSTVFGADGQWGLTLAANAGTQQRDLTKYNANGLMFFDQSGKKIASPSAPGWNGYRAVPDTARSYDFNNRVSDRKGISARLEWKPNDSSYHSLLLYGYGQDYTENRNEYSLNSLSGMQNQTDTSGTLSVGRADAAFYMDTIDRRSRGAIYHSRFDFDELSRLDVRAGYSFSGYDNTAPQVRYRLSNAGGLLDYWFDGKHYGFDVREPERYGNASGYKLASASTTQTASEADATEFKLDYSHNMDNGSLGWGWKFGAGLRDYALERDVTVTNYVINPVFTLAGYSDYHFTPGYFPLPSMVVDYAKFSDEVLPTLGINAASSLKASGTEDFRYDETIGWGYGMFGYATDSTKVVAGLRYDKANYTGHAPETVNGVFDPRFVPSKGKYDHWLPSANLLHSFNDSWRLKAAYSRTLGRPMPNQIAEPSTINQENQTISQGNPDLRPRVSDNFDVAVEWFIDGYDSAMTLGLFHKQIKDDIFRLASEVQIDGLAWLSTRPMNAEGSTISGVEFGYINNRIPHLPGFLRDKVGMSTNLMWSDGSMDYIAKGQHHQLDQLVDQSEWLANLAVFYALPQGGEVRLAWNYQSASLTTLGDEPYLNRGTDDYDSLDFSLRHHFGTHWLVKFDARNLLNEKRNLAVGEDLEWWRSEGESGRTFSVHLIYKM